jgi:hypothetical protein
VYRIETSSVSVVECISLSPSATGPHDRRSVLARGHLHYSTREADDGSGEPALELLSGQRQGALSSQEESSMPGGIFADDKVRLRECQKKDPLCGGSE